MLIDGEGAKSVIEALYGNPEIEQNISVTDMGETFMGQTVQICIEPAEGIEDETTIMYFGQNEYDFYEIWLVLFKGASEEETEDAYKAIDMLFETGGLK